MNVSRVPFLGLAQNINQQGGLAQSQRITSMEQSGSVFTEKYGSNSMDPTFIPVAREQYRNGLGPMPLGALGKNAINGTTGGNLNISA